MATALHRPLRVAGLLKREIAMVLRNKINDPRLHRLIVTDVEVSRGCSHAKVYISVPKPGDEQQTLEAIIGAAGFIRTHLSSSLELKFMPKLSFKIDNSYEQGKRIDDILDNVSE